MSNAALGLLDIAIARSMRAVGLSDVATFKRRLGPNIPCVAMIDRAVEYFDASGQSRFDRIEIGLRRSEIGVDPVQGDVITISGESFSVQSVSARDESMVRVVVR